MNLRCCSASNVEIQFVAQDLCCLFDFSWVSAMVLVCVDRIFEPLTTVSFEQVSPGDLDRTNKTPKTPFSRKMVKS